MSKDPPDLLTLPAELLLMILQMVQDESMTDLLSATYSCWRIRKTSMALLFRRVYVAWEKLDTFIHELKQEQSQIIASCVVSLRLSNASSWGEWHKEKQLGDLVSMCPNIRELSLNLSGSSSWLKYIPHCPQIERLAAISQVAVDWASVNKDRKNEEPSLPDFDLFDLQKLPSVKKLYLEGFHLSDYSTIESDEVVRYSFVDVSLKNCIWSFPFDFKNVNCSLTNFKAEYTEQFRGFTYSERLRSLFQSPPSGLKSFSLHFPADAHKSWCWTLAGKKSFNQLTHLSLSGFQIPGDDFFKQIPNSLKQLDMKVRPTLKQTTDTIEKMSKQIRDKHETNTLKINIYSVHV